MNKHDTIARLSALATLAGPVTLVWALKSFTGVGPVHAPGAVPSSEASPQQIGTPEPAASSPDALKAATYIASWAPSSQFQSPMDHPQAVRQPEPEPVAQKAEPVKAPEVDPVFVVSAVAGAPGGGLATINGKVRRVGDALAPGWSIASIDPQNRRVTIAGPDGRSLVRAAGR